MSKQQQHYSDKRTKSSSEDTVGNSLTKSPKDDSHVTTLSKKKELQIRNKTMELDVNSKQDDTHRNQGGDGLLVIPSKT